MIHHGPPAFMLRYNLSRAQTPGMNVPLPESSEKDEEPGSDPLSTAPAKPATSRVGLADPVARLPGAFKTILK
jgi:hypothetical protein